jgi:1,4-alpha-glucan branching enzyme
LAQASDWPFIMRTNTSPDYARRRVTDHLSRFNHLFEQLKQGCVDEGWLQDVESRDNLFAGLRTEYWR